MIDFIGDEKGSQRTRNATLTRHLDTFTTTYLGIVKVHFLGECARASVPTTTYRIHVGEGQRGRRGDWGDYEGGDSSLHRKILPNLEANWTRTETATQRVKRKEENRQIAKPTCFGGIGCCAVPFNVEWGYQKTFKHLQEKQRRKKT